MTPFIVFVLVDGTLIGLLVCSLISLFRTSGWPMLVKVAVAIAFGILACWQPLATRAILGYPQIRDMAELPDRFELFAEHSLDDKSFDLWIATSEQPAPLAVTVVPDKALRQVLRQAQQKLAGGAPVFISRNSKQGGGGGGGTALNGEHGDAHDGAARTGFTDDQDRWVLTIPRMPAKGGE